jgi:hypothetical protein
MSLEELKQELSGLSPDQRHELSAYLVRLELESGDNYWRDVRRRIDDKNPDNWVSVEQLTD